MASKKWEYYYRPESIAKQRQFFDHFLKELPSGLETWPKVLIEVREAAHQGEFRAEREWPLARTLFRPLFLDAAVGRLSNSLPKTSC